MTGPTEGTPIAQVPAGTAAGHDDWERHWARYADVAEENPAQAYRRATVLRLLDAGAGARILDIGCGSGDTALDIRRALTHAAVAGIDLSDTGIALAARKVPDGVFRQIDLAWPVEPPAELAGWATHAVCTEVLEHLDDPVAFLQHARPFLAPGARLVVTVPGGPRSAFDRYIGHRRHFTVADLQQVLEAAGFEQVDASGAGFPFFNLYRLVVVAAGRRVIDDVTATEEGGASSGAARALMRTFGVLFRANLPRHRWGWQRVAVAVAPS